MPRVQALQYSKLYDLKTKTEFVEQVDARTGLRIGIAEVSDEAAEDFAQRDGFRVLETEEYEQILGLRPARVILEQTPALEPLAEAVNLENSKPGAAAADPLSEAPEPPASANE